MKTTSQTEDRRPKEDFGPFDGRIWLDTAHQGPLPRVAAEAARDALARQVSPTRLDDDAFYVVPDRLKRVLGRLVDAPPDRIVLGNSTSYGLHLLANGIPWRSGDEVLLVAGDFPASILPWLGLRDRGVRVRLMEPEGPVPTPDELDDAIGARTRLFCASWVNSFTGHAVDPGALGRVCAARDVRFVLNGSQGVGSRPSPPPDAPIDALVSCGFKWLCGPYGTGFLRLDPELMDALKLNRTYWLAMQRGRTLDRMRDYEVRDDLGSARYDVFGTANFLNFEPWTASVEYLLEWGLPEVHEHAQGLVDRLVDGLETLGYRIRSPREGPARSALVLFEHPSGEGSARAARRLEGAGVDTSLREGRIRAAPHVHNTADDVDRLLEALGPA